MGEPVPAGSQNAERDAAIYEERLAGATRKQIAEKHGLSIARVVRILDRERRRRKAGLE